MLPILLLAMTNKVVIDNRNNPKQHIIISKNTWSVVSSSGILAPYLKNGFNVSFTP
jgi:hypothetical protein